MPKYLPFALPLFIAILNVATPASAEQIGRSDRISAGEAKSKISDAIPAVTDLNLMVPVSANKLSPHDGESAAERRDQIDSIEPFWADPDRNNSATVSIKKKTSKLNSRLKSAKPVSIKSSGSVASEQSHKPKSIVRSKSIVTRNIDAAPTAIARGDRKLKSSSRQKIAAIFSPSLSGNYLRLIREPDKGTNDLGNPIYTLEAYVDGRIYQRFNAVSGTATTQTANRDRENNFAPLPDGLYAVSNQIVAGVVPEVGRTFIGISPKFETGRTDLGIHLDRSFNQRNGYDGTAGCIGLTTTTDRDAINEFVTKYRPYNLLVKILSPENG